MHAATICSALAGAAALLAVLTTPALAQPRAPAPIVFAAQNSGQGMGPALSASAVDSAASIHLLGGDDASYGYGAPQSPRSGAIDLRRAANASSAPQPAEQGAAGWLEPERVGPPYEANGRWYVPTPEPGYAQTGTASWYGPGFHGRDTATGETYDETALTAAHPTLPIPSLVQVTNLENGREAIVRINDRGPFVGERLIDVSRKTAEVLGFEQQGRAQVHVRYLGPAPQRVSAQNLPSPLPAQQLPVQQQPTDAADGPRSLLPPASSEPEPGTKGRLAAFAPTPTALAAAAPAAAAPAAGLMVQVGAFADLANAHRLQAQLAAIGPAEIDIRQTGRGELFRVRIGPFASRDAAERAQAAAAELGLRDTVLAAR